MKFKKVEIQAFRAYDKVKDSTFDFTRKEDGVNADFVSLYAPNGFGKTSFYDAVEYGITNNIDRFLRKGKETFNSVKSERNIRSKNNQYFLINNNSDETLQSFIKLYTVESEKPIETTIDKPRTKAGYDYKFDPEATINKEFQTTILSQEWIDAFLKEDKPEERYNTFIEYFGDKKIDEYYQKLVILIGLNNKRIDSLTKELSGIQLELKFEGDKDILKKVNEKIISLSEAGEKMTPIDNSYSESDALDLANKISERTVEIEFEIKKEIEFTKYLDVFVRGNEQVEGISKYFESKEKIQQLEMKSREFLELSNKFENFKKKQNEIESLLNDNKKLDLQKRRLEAIKIEFVEYSKVTTDIKKHEADGKKMAGEIETLSLKLNENNQLSELLIRQKSLQEQISNAENNLIAIPKSKGQISNIKNHLIEFQNIKNDLSKKLEELEKQKINLESVLTTLKQTVSNIALRIFPIDTDLDYIEYSELIKKIEVNVKALKAQEEKLTDVDVQIKAQEFFQKEIEIFISKGAEIINKNRTNSCPLCEQEYESYTFLASKVSNNKLLSSVISTKLNDRNEIVGQIELLNKAVENDSKNLAAKITKKSLSIEDRLKIINGELSSVITSLNSSLKEIESLNKSLNDLLVSTNGGDIELYEVGVKNKIISLKEEYSELVRIKEALEKGKIENEDNLERHKKNSINIKLTIDMLYKDVKYNNVLNFFKEEFPGKEISNSLIESNIKTVVSLLNDNAVKETNLKLEISALSEVLNSYSKDDIEKQNSILIGTRDLYVKIVSSYEQEVESKLSINMRDFPQEKFMIFLNDKRKSSLDNIKKQEGKIKDFNILLKYKENVVPFLKFETAKIKANDTKARIEFLRTKITPKLESEKNKVSEHLTQQINSFFYEGLINDLYKRIDPHPDYKKVKFKCDFGDSKPKLNVCVFQTNEDELIIPTLYFSTAQLNILSLSIFLAKALNAKDENGKSLDCIFIDDPIQSMDSINILSTIDLIRSIVVNQKKQIILSTHDENFHNLLKKKMPTNLFNSKFMELETFGKVKNETN